jgi:uncharacterized protein YecA (UPF0149 family)
MFRETEEQIKAEIVKLLPNLGTAFRPDTASLTQSVHESVLNPSIKVQLAAIPKNTPEIGRNDDCPCGSGKKYKKCGLLNTPEHQQLMAKK